MGLAAIAASQQANAQVTNQFLTISGYVNPTIAPGRKASRGTIYLWVNNAGIPGVFQKQDDTTDTNWAPIGGSAIVVVYPSTAPYEAVAGTTIPFVSSAPISIYYIQGDGGADQDMTATVPQIADGLVDGQILKLIGLQAVGAGAVTIGGATVGSNVKLNGLGVAVLDDNNAIELIWDAGTSVWRELSRLS